MGWGQSRELKVDGEIPDTRLVFGMRSLGRSLIFFFAFVWVSGICYQIPHLPMEQETLFYLGDLAH